MLPIIDKNPKKGQEKATMATMHTTQCYRGTGVYVNSRYTQYESMLRSCDFT